MRQLIIYLVKKISNFSISPIMILVYPSSIIGSEDRFNTVQLSYYIIQTIIKTFKDLI